jgi:hypothetical protein
MFTSPLASSLKQSRDPAERGAAGGSGDRRTSIDPSSITGISPALRGRGRLQPDIYSAASPASGPRHLTAAAVPSAAAATPAVSLQSRFAATPPSTTAATAAASSPPSTSVFKDQLRQMCSSATNASAARPGGRSLRLGASSPPTASLVDDLSNMRIRDAAATEGGGQEGRGLRGLAPGWNLELTPRPGQHVAPSSSHHIDSLDLQRSLAHVGSTTPGLAAAGPSGRRPSRPPPMLPAAAPPSGKANGAGLLSIARPGDVAEGVPGTHQTTASFPDEGFTAREAFPMGTTSTAAKAAAPLSLSATDALSKYVQLLVGTDAAALRRELRGWMPDMCLPRAPDPEVSSSGLRSAPEGMRAGAGSGEYRGLPAEKRVEKMKVLRGEGQLLAEEEGGDEGHAGGVEVLPEGVPVPGSVARELSPEVAERLRRLQALREQAGALAGGGGGGGGGGGLMRAGFA